jgi:hypothetical protein
MAFEGVSETLEPDTIGQGDGFESTKETVEPVTNAKQPSNNHPVRNIKPPIGTILQCPRKLRKAMLYNPPLKNRIPAKNIPHAALASRRSRVRLESPRATITTV